MTEKIKIIGAINKGNTIEDPEKTLSGKDETRQKEVIESAEKIPTQEEIKTVFDQFAEGAEYKTRVKEEDEKGIYVWEIVIPIEDGGTVEYLYGRKGVYGKRRHLETTIESASFDETGFPDGGGGTVARYENGAWRMVVDEDNNVKSPAELSSENANSNKPIGEWREMEKLSKTQEDYTSMLIEANKLIKTFEEVYDLDALHAIKKINKKEISNYPERERAKTDLETIFSSIRLLERTTNITQKELDVLKSQYRKFSQAIGIINEETGVVDHVLLGDDIPFGRF